MRQCHFCERWFKNKQAVRRHLGFCKDYLTASYDEKPWRRVELLQCAHCKQAYGDDITPKITSDEMHELVDMYGGCDICGTNLWARAGWKREPVD